MITFRAGCLTMIGAVLIGVPASRADEPRKTDRVTITLAELRPEHDGREVTMVLHVTQTQLIGGAREGESPHVLLHYPEMKRAPHLAVFAKGDLADALHRFACVGSQGRLIGRSIQVTGVITVHRDSPPGEHSTPGYELVARDWRSFRIPPEAETP